MRGWVWRFYLGAGALATGGYDLLSDGAGAVLNVVVGASTVAAVAAGIRWHRPPRWAAEQERTRIAVELHDGPIQRLSVLSYDLERARQRVLGNPAAVARLEHAQAKRLWLELEGQGDRVHLCIRDDGVGFDLPSAA
jgi:signal transduction histidine kinase